MVHIPVKKFLDSEEGARVNKKQLNLLRAITQIYQFISGEQMGFMILMGDLFRRKIYTPNDYYSVDSGSTYKIHSVCKSKWVMQMCCLNLHLKLTAPFFLYELFSI